MYRVLVPVDGNEDRALRQAAYVAGLPGSGEVEALLLYVFTSDDEARGRDRTVTRVGSVRRVRERLEDHGIEVDLLDDSGDPADEILDVAEEYDVDAVVMGGRKRSPAGKALFGSVTQDVIRGTDRPVVVTGD